MEIQFSFKDFDDVRLKAIEPLIIGERSIESGETIAKFDRIQIAGLGDIRERVAARGGYGNRVHVFWDTLKEQRLNFQQGVFSKTQFALFNNSKLIVEQEDSVIPLTIEEELESDAELYVYLSYMPVGKVFIYDKSTGEKIAYAHRGGTRYRVNNPYNTVIAVYERAYTDGAKLFQFGRNLFNTFIELEGYTRLKDDVTGNIVTGLLHIPKLRLMSNLDIRLGQNANPIVANFDGICVPVGDRYDSYCSELYILNDDVQSDF